MSETFSNTTTSSELYKRYEQEAAKVRILQNKLQQQKEELHRNQDQLQQMHDKHSHATTELYKRVYSMKEGQEAAEREATKSDVLVAHRTELLRELSKSVTNVKLQLAYNFQLNTVKGDFSIVGEDVFEDDRAAAERLEKELNSEEKLIAERRQERREAARGTLQQSEETGTQNGDDEGEGSDLRRLLFDQRAKDQQHGKTTTAVPFMTRAQQQQHEQLHPKTAGSKLAPSARRRRSSVLLVKQVEKAIATQNECLQRQMESGKLSRQGYINGLNELEKENELLLELKALVLTSNVKIPWFPPNATQEEDEDEEDTAQGKRTNKKTTHQLLARGGSAAELAAAARRELEEDEAVFLDPEVDKTNWKKNATEGKEAASGGDPQQPEEREGDRNAEEVEISDDDNEGVNAQQQQQECEGVEAGWIERARALSLRRFQASRQEPHQEGGLKPPVMQRHSRPQSATTSTVQDVFRSSTSASVASSRRRRAQTAGMQRPEDAENAKIEQQCEKEQEEQPPHPLVPRRPSSACLQRSDAVPHTSAALNQRYARRAQQLLYHKEPQHQTGTRGGQLATTASGKENSGADVEGNQKQLPEGEEAAQRAVLFKYRLSSHKQLERVVAKQAAKRFVTYANPAATATTTEAASGFGDSVSVEGDEEDDVE